MNEIKIREALRRLGTRRTAPAEICPVCGDPVKGDRRAVKAWPGKYAHERCARYARRGSGRTRRTRRGLKAA